MNDFDDIAVNLANLAKLLSEDATERFNEMRKCSFFDPIPSECLEPISKLAKIRTFPAEDRITREGGDMSSFYVILLGTASAYRNDKVVGTIHRGGGIGEGTFFASENITRSATVFADEQLIVAELNKADIDSLDSAVRTYMDKALMIALFKKLQGANRMIEELLSEYTPPETDGIVD